MRSPACGVALLLLGCAQSNEAQTVTGPCAPTRVDCPNERTAPLLDECGDAAHDPSCGSSYQSYFRCRQSKQLCDGRGRLDVDASVAACANELDAWTTCSLPIADSSVDTFLPDAEALPDTRDSAVSDSAADTRADTKTDTRAD